MLLLERSPRLLPVGRLWTCVALGVLLIQFLSLVLVFSSVYAVVILIIYIYIYYINVVVI